MDKLIVNCPLCDEQRCGEYAEYADLQHHLWGRHNVEVIESHKIAESFFIVTKTKKRRTARILARERARHPAAVNG